MILRGTPKNGDFPLIKTVFWEGNSETILNLTTLPLQIFVSPALHIYQLVYDEPFLKPFFPHCISLVRFSIPCIQHVVFQDIKRPTQVR